MTVKNSDVFGMRIFQMCDCKVNDGNNVRDGKYKLELLCYHKMPALAMRLCSRH